MKRGNYVTECAFCIVCAAALLLIACGSKEQKIVARIGGKPVMMSTVRDMVPGSDSDSSKVTRALMRMVLAGSAPAEGDSACAGQVDSLAQQLSLQSGIEWRDSAANVLYRAACGLAGKISELQSKDRVTAYIESLFVSINPQTDIARIREQLNGSVHLADKISVNDNDAMAALFAVVFQIPDQAASVLAEFLESSDIASGAANIEEMVKGLISDGHEPKQVRAPRVPVLQHDNSVSAMRFRSQQSIRDSISRHIPNLQLLYKKQLKTDQDIGGVVMVSIRVNASGQVISAKIKSSDIASRQFLNPFIDYVKTIRFRAIPEDVGNMTFEFPFEFSSES